MKNRLLLFPGIFIFSISLFIGCQNSSSNTISSADNKETEIKLEDIPAQTNSKVTTAEVAEQKTNKEFNINSFTQIIDGEYFPQFSQKTITVNKGDVVKLKITDLSGNHNFVIDEYNIHQETPLNKVTVIEFTATKAGDFTYYCSKPNHKQLGQWGTLKVLNQAASSK